MNSILYERKREGLVIILIAILSTFLVYEYFHTFLVVKKGT